MPKLVLRANQFALIHSAVTKEAYKVEKSLISKLALILNEKDSSLYFPDKYEEACKKLQKSLDLLNTKIRLIELENEDSAEETNTTLDDLKNEASKVDAMLKEIQNLYSTLNELKYIGIILEEKSKQRDSIFDCYDITEEERKENRRNGGSDNYLI